HGVGDFLGLSHEDGRVGRTAQDALSGFGKALESVFAPQVKLLEEEARAEQERLNSFDHLFEQGKLQLTGLDDIIANLDTGSPLYEMLVSNRDSLVSTLERMVAEEVVKGNLEAAKGNELIESLKMVAEEQVEEIKKNKEVNMMVVESMNKWWAASEARRAAEEEKKFADAAAEAGSSASLAGAFRTAGHSDFNPYEGRFDSLSEEQVLAQIAHYENLRKRNIAENNTLEGGGIALHGEAALSHRGFGHALTELKEVLMEIRDDTRISASATSQTAVNTGSV
ncbi:MAG: hypothetical protein OXC91_12115, partial [Rhodobacteraceae bacterium]|nr:hypothetical protein [Paracoccaceae bacterium]